MSLQPAVSPPHSSGSSPAPSRRFTREDVLKLGQANRPWEFVPVALAALKIAPEDAALRFLLAAAYARLGLGTAAREQIEILPEAARTDRGVQTLAGVLGSLPPDEVTVEERARVCRANVGALAGRNPERGGVDLRGSVEKWARGAAGVQCFRARDGNVVVRTWGSTGAWNRFRDDVGEAKGMTLTDGAAEPGDAGRGPADAGPIKPCILEGMDPPWMFRRVLELMPPGADRYRPRITIVQGDVDELLDGLALADLRAALGDERVRVLVGPDASERLEADLLARVDTQMLGPVVSLATVRTRIFPPVNAIVQEAAAMQQREQERLYQEVRSVYTGRDRPWWGRRYAGDGAKLRVLIPTCRFSTYIKHSATDLARAMEAAGHEARVLMEPDEHSHVASVGYLRVLAEFKPDLIVLINYTRANLGPVIPPEVPFVCWVQDAMPHQFSANVGRLQTDMDFVIGHVHPELVKQFGYPAARTVPMPMIASEEKFHAGPVDPALAARLECEIAMVTHHSETPRAMHERLVHEARREPAVGRIFERLWQRVEAIALDPMTHRGSAELRAAAVEASREVLGAQPDDRILTLISRQYCLPMADRMVRHQTLEWGADVARRRGWRLRIYGRGWDRHPSLAEFAVGELAHGEELRAAYQCAAVQLHASINWLLHQRVMECSLSGGLPLCRLKRDDLANWLGLLVHRLIRDGEPAACDLNERRDVFLGYPTAEDAEAMLYAATLQRLGMEGSWVQWVRPELYRQVRDQMRDEPAAVELAGTSLLGDLADTTFWTPVGLEKLVERAVQWSAWRRDLSEGIARRVRDGYTSGAFARRVVEMVGRWMGDDRRGPDESGPEC